MSTHTKNLAIMKQYRAINERFRALHNEQFKHLNITSTQGMMIGLVAQNKALTISALAQQMNLSLSTVSEMVKRMEKEGYLVRERDESDRRIVLVKLSDEIRSNKEDLFSHFISFVDQLFSRASEEELTSIQKGLETFERLLIDHADAQDKENGQ